MLMSFFVRHFVQLVAAQVERDASTFRADGLRGAALLSSLILPVEKAAARAFAACASKGRITIEVDYGLDGVLHQAMQRWLCARCAFIEKLPAPPDPVTQYVLPRSVAVPPSSGIYFLWTHDLQLASVGQAGDLADRLRQWRLNNPNGRVERGDLLSWLLLPPSQLNRAERFYQAVYDPPRDRGMPPVSWRFRRKAWPPKYCLHRGTGQAYVRISSRRKYLGRYGTAESYARYEEIVGQPPLSAAARQAAAAENAAAGAVLSPDSAPDRSAR